MLSNVNDIAAGHVVIHQLRNLALEDDFAAQFAAGLAYGVSGRTVDIRDYLVDCMKDNKGLTRKLNRAFVKFNQGKLEKGALKLQKAEKNFKKATKRCAETGAYFDELFLDFNAFLDREDFEEIATANYLANKDFVDVWLGNGLASWEWGVEFNAGMFFGEVYDKLSEVPTPPAL